MDQRTRRARIADVAREAGVSKTAVSFAFNAPDRLATDTADRIREVARRLGYTPHPVARMLTQRRTMTIGVLTPQALSVMFGNPFFGAFSEGLALAAEGSGYGLHFLSPLHGSLVRALTTATVDGVVVIGLSNDHPEVDQIRRSGVPIVLVDSEALPDHASVEVDDVGGARAAGRHMVDLGHRDVVVIAIEPPAPGALTSSGVTDRRLRGYREAFATAGVHLTDDRVALGPATVEGGISALRALWRSGLRPTAVLAMSDAMAMGAMRVLRDLGLDVPQDVSVIGFDDIDLASLVDPPLTTIHQPIRQKGEEALRALLALVAGDAGASPKHHSLETRLMVRGSTGPVPMVRRPGPRS